MHGRVGRRDRERAAEDVFIKAGVHGGVAKSLGNGGNGSAGLLSGSVCFHEVEIRV